MTDKDDFIKNPVDGSPLLRPMLSISGMLAIIFVLYLIKCSQDKTDDREWKPIWEKSKADLKTVVGLIKADKLKVTYGRSCYQIPDSIDLKVPFGQQACRFTDFTYDSTYSILFTLDPSKNLRNCPVIVYTNNKKRIQEYTADNEIKIENNWYFVHQ